MQANLDSLSKELTLISAVYLNDNFDILSITK